MARRRYSAGLLPFRRTGGEVEVFIVHMGGPYWSEKDEGAWSIAKGEYDPAGEQPVGVARREFAEETGQPAPDGELLDLGETRQPSGKRLQVFALETDAELRFVESNLFSMEWPPRSGRMAEFPEVDGARWFALDDAAGKLVSGQVPILAALARAIADA